MISRAVVIQLNHSDLWTALYQARRTFSEVNRQILMFLSTHVVIPAVLLLFFFRPFLLNHTHSPSLESIISSEVCIYTILIRCALNKLTVWTVVFMYSKFFYSQQIFRWDRSIGWRIGGQIQRRYARPCLTVSQPLRYTYIHSGRNSICW